MIIEKAGLDVGNQSNAGALELADHRGRIGEFVAVPSKYVASRADAAVAGAEMECADRDVLVRGLVDETREARLRVCGVGEAHGRVGVTQAPARAEGHAPGQLGELAYH